MPYGPDKCQLYMSIETGDVCTIVNHSSTDMPPSHLPYEYPKLSSEVNGGMGGVCFNKHHYGEPCCLIQPTLGRDMGDGWETARHPSHPPILVRDPNTHSIDSPLMDWEILKLKSYQYLQGCPPTPISVAQQSQTSRRYRTRLQFFGDFSGLTLSKLILLFLSIYSEYYCILHNLGNMLIGSAPRRVTRLKTYYPHTSEYA
jgi:hypothetical protein